MIEAIKITARYTPSVVVHLDKGAIKEAYSDDLKMAELINEAKAKGIDKLRREALYVSAHLDQSNVIIEEEVIL